VIEQERKMQRTRKLTQLENSMINKHIGRSNASWIDNKGRAVFTSSQIEQAFAAEHAERAEVQQKQMKNDSEYFTSAEFRQDVIDELMENGATLEQATNRTRDQARLFNEAQQLGLM
jgi:hypothetical protein